MISIMTSSQSLNQSYVSVCDPVLGDEGKLVSYLYVHFFLFFQATTRIMFGNDIS